MNSFDALQVVSLVAVLVLVVSAYASYRLEWREMVRQMLIWGAIFAGLTLLISFLSG
ncbi:hypothetical protein U4960_08330 [Altererythrobacter sp. H2]|uniref:hypothetical protein n=1 Tax=Altererythrobacter sp. H2 TaxID=3108391 RepID=UPI002B4C1AE1|nr:hypothetical protein [Altererythrobacter sp. H2]WRK94312.1 hypothetical protein U4960_08330 [Altererythrobacter sp. H2]